MQFSARLTEERVEVAALGLAVVLLVLVLQVALVAVSPSSVWTRRPSAKS